MKKQSVVTSGSGFSLIIKKHDKHSKKEKQKIDLPVSSRSTAATLLLSKSKLQRIRKALFFIFISIFLIEYIFNCEVSLSNYSYKKNNDLLVIPEMTLEGDDGESSEERTNQYKRLLLSLSTTPSKSTLTSSINLPTIHLVKKHYRKLALSTHPDHGGSTDRFNAIREAYDSILEQFSSSSYGNDDDDSATDVGRKLLDQKGRYDKDDKDVSSLEFLIQLNSIF